MIQQLRAQISQRPLHPYDLIRDTPVEISRDCAKLAIAGKSYTLKGMEFFLDEPTDWEAKKHARSHRMYIQAWNFLEPLFVHYSDKQDTKSRKLLLSHVDNWIKKFGSAQAIQDDITAVADDLNNEGLFVGHPMAIAGRFYRLAYVIDIAARTKSIKDQQILTYIEVLQWHAFFISVEEYFLEKHNHGVQAALSQLVGAARLLDISSGKSLFSFSQTIEETFAQGKRRLFQTLSEHVCSDGTHKEHSPHYHIVVANAIREPIVNGIITDAIVKDIFDALVEMSSWLFDFKGRVINMGDSDLDLLAAGAHNYKNKSWPREPVGKLFVEGGYWFVKGTTQSGKHYLAHQAAMHSRTHKHPDTGTFIWMDRGRDILIDAGRFGYVGRTEVGSALFNDGFWYADPRRVYVESTRAHNTIAIDGKNHPRFRSKPFGSAIWTSTEKNGVFACESSVPNLSGMSHFRILAHKPGDWLLCIDTIRAADGKSHDLKQHFHLHPDWLLEQCGNDSALFLSKNEELHVSAIFDNAAIVETARGRGNPEEDEATDLFGWWSPRHMLLEPCNSLTMAARDSYATIATLFTFAPADIDKNFSTFNTTRRRMRFRWTCKGVVQSLIIDRDQGKDGQRTLLLS